jgi:glycosyltransferase involved in cell wall biosynthesis
MKPKVLVFIDWFLPGNKAGGPVTSIGHIVENLKEQVDFYVMTRDTDYGDNRPYPHVRSNHWMRLEEGLHVYYFSNEELTYGNLKQVAFGIDCAHWYINGMYSYYFSILPVLMARSRKDIKMTVATRGMLSPHALAVKPIKKMVYLCFSKMLGIYKGINFHATNAEEAFEIRRRLGDHLNIKIASNLTATPSPFNPKQGDKVAGVLKLLSLARISPEKNILGALRSLSDCNYNVQFDLYGQQLNQEYMQQCQAEAYKLPANIQVTFHGSVPTTDVPGILQRADFLFLPTHGENFGHSILEAMLAGCPVIISDKTPWRNLEEKGLGWDISLTEQKRFKEVLGQAAAMDADTYEKMSHAAFTYAKDFAVNTELLAANLALFV